MDQLDPEGYIRPEADLANVQPEYQGLPDAAAGLLAEVFGPLLHSAYLYGSVVRGNAVRGRSDIDVIAVLLATPVEEDRVRADRVERALVERFPVLVSASVGLTHLQEIRSPAQRSSGQVFLRELAVCIYLAWLDRLRLRRLSVLAPTRSARFGKDRRPACRVGGPNDGRLPGDRPLGPAPIHCR